MEALPSQASGSCCGERHPCYRASSFVSWRATDGATLASSHIIVGIVWATWHLPFISEISHHTTEGLFAFLPRFYLGCIAGAIMYGEIRAATGSVWPAVLMHWTGNAVANPLMSDFASLVPGWEQLGSPGVDGMLVLILSATLGLAVHRWRSSRE